MEAIGTIVVCGQPGDRVGVWQLPPLFSGVLPNSLPAEWCLHVQSLEDDSLTLSVPADVPVLLRVRGPFASFEERCTIPAGAQVSVHLVNGREHTYSPPPAEQPDTVSMEDPCA